jgi:hypothetical protein
LRRGDGRHERRNRRASYGGEMGGTMERVECIGEVGGTMERIACVGEVWVARWRGSRASGRWAA